MDKKTLIRPKEGRMLFGVCAGLANYFDIDPIWVRLVFVVLTVWGGAGVLIYIVCILIIPEDKSATKKDDSGKDKKDDSKIHERVEAVASEVKSNFGKNDFRMRGEQIFGLIVLFLGLAFLVQNFFSWFNFAKFWPLALIILGIIILAGGTRGRQK